MSLSAARADARTCHFIVHARAPSVCYAACSPHSPRSAFVSLPLRVGSISALGNHGAPKLRRSGGVEVVAHRDTTRCSGEKVSTCDGRGGRAPRIEAAQCDDLAAPDAPLLLQLMRHNDCDQRPPADLHCAPRAQNIELRSRRAPYALPRSAASHCYTACSPRLRS
jgi:hypothetical protein